MRRHFRGLVAACRKACAAGLLGVAAASAHAGAYDDFFRAAVADNGYVLRDLIARGMDANSRDPSGQPAVFVAFRAEAYEAAMTLITAPGFDPNLRNASGETALMLAALKGEMNLCQALLARGASIEPGPWTPLHYAASGPSLPILRLLLERGANVNARSPNGRTPLMQAAQYGTEEAVQVLLRAGADVRLEDRWENTAVDAARLSGRDFLVKQLQALMTSPAASR